MCEKQGAWWIYAAGCIAVGLVHGPFISVGKAVVWVRHCFKGSWELLTVASLESFERVKDLEVRRFPAAQVTGKARSVPAQPVKSAALPAPHMTTKASTRSAGVGLRERDYIGVLYPHEQVRISPVGVRVSVLRPNWSDGSSRKLCIRMPPLCLWVGQSLMTSMRTASTGSGCKVHMRTREYSEDQGEWMAIKASPPSLFMATL